MTISPEFNGSTVFGELRLNFALSARGAATDDVSTRAGVSALRAYRCNRHR